MRSALKTIAVYSIIGPLSLLRLVRRNHKANRILVINHFFIGDLLFLTPLLRSIRDFFPKAEIDVWINIRSSPILAGFSGLHEIFQDITQISRLNSTMLIIKRLWTNRTNLHSMRSRRYEIVLDTSGYFDTAIAVQYISGRRTFGITDFSAYKIGYDIALDNRLTAKHLKLLYLDLLDFIGIPAQDRSTQLEFNVIPEAVGSTHGFVAELEAKYSHLICFAPFAGWKTKEWPLQYYYDLCSLINGKLPGCGFLFLGTQDDQFRLQANKGQWPRHLIDCTGKFKLQEIGAIIQQADLLIGSDSAPAHMAEALGTPSVIIFGSTNPAFSSPENQSKHRVLVVPIHCSPRERSQYCHEDNNYRCESKECLECISPDRVLEEVLTLVKIYK